MAMMKKILIVLAACLASSTTTAKPEQDHEQAPVQNDMSDVKVTISQGNTDLTPQSMTNTDLTPQSMTEEKPDQEIMIGETKVTIGNVDQLEIKPEETAGTSAAAATAAQQYAVTALLAGAAAGMFSFASMM